MSEMTLDSWRRIAEGLEARVAEFEDAIENLKWKITECKQECAALKEKVSACADLTNIAQREAKQWKSKAQNLEARGGA